MTLTEPRWSVWKYLTLRVSDAVRGTRMPTLALPTDGRKKETPAAGRGRGFCDRTEVRSICADVDGAQAIAERGGHAAQLIATVVAIAATHVANAEAMAPVVMIATPATTPSPRLGGSGGRSQRRRAEGSRGNKSKCHF